MTTIIAKKNLYNAGLCFTKGKKYQVNKDVSMEPSLMDCITTNDQGQPHQIGSWWREFKIEK